MLQDMALGSQRVRGHVWVVRWFGMACFFGSGGGQQGGGFCEKLLQASARSDRANL